MPPAAPIDFTTAGSLSGAPTGVATPTGVGVGSSSGRGVFSFLQENKSTVNKKVHKVSVMRCMVKLVLVAPLRRSKTIRTPLLPMAEPV